MNIPLISPCKSSIRDFKSQKWEIISPHIEICRKGTDFEEFEKKWISAINNNNNKQTFKTASAYQLTVKNKLFIFDELQVLFTEFVDWALEKNLDLEDDVDEEAPAAEPEEAAPAEAAAEPEATEAAEAPEASTEASEAPAEEAPKEEKPAEAAEWMPG